MSFTLRCAVPADAEVLHQFICELATYEREPDAVEVTTAELAAQLGASKPPFECVLAELEGVAVGFALFFHNYSTWRGRRGLYLEDLFVDPAHRGLGIGAALFARLARIAVQRGCARMEWSVLDWNTPAIGFYERLGAGMMDGWHVWRLTGAALAQVASDTSER